jgi:hypothetical protein
VVQRVVNGARSSAGYGAVAGVLLVVLSACSGAAEHPSQAMTPVASDQPRAGLDLGSQQDAGACVGVEATAQELPVDMFAVLDGSASMAEATATGVSKWYATKAAFHDFLASAEPGMGFGLSLFPTPDEAPSCSSQHYRDSALPITAVSQMVQGALARLDAVVPQGQTPTAPALTAALEQATIYALSHLDRSVVVVLATDGLPTTCTPTDTNALAELAKEAFDGPGHVRTVVVASESLSGGGGSGFESIAKAGGTGHALSIDPRTDFARQLSRALHATADRKVACDLALPEPPKSERLDYDAVNVVLEGDDGRTTFPRVESSAGCTTKGGWYYDVDPKSGAPSRLNMCKASCERLSTATSKLRVELGCKTVVR